jgi:hypothetical protein
VEEVCHTRNAQNGFNTTGLYPINPVAITNSAYVPSEPSEQPDPNATSGDYGLASIPGDVPCVIGHLVENESTW